MSVSVSPPLTWDSATSPWFEGNSDMHLSRLVHESFDENPIIGPFTIDFTPSVLDDYSDHEGSLKIIFSNAGPVTFIDPNTNESWFKEYENIPAVTIEPNEVWVIGDNREDSLFGHFPIKEINGKIILY